LEHIEEEELLELKSSLEKKMASKDLGTLMSILKVVGQKKVTYDLLKNTKIGKTIGELKSMDPKNYPEDAVSDLGEIKITAEKLIKAWKEVCDKEKSAKEKNGKKEERKVKKGDDGIKEPTKTSMHEGLVIPEGVVIETG